MNDLLDARTAHALRSYWADVRALPNEAAKRMRFGALVAELFPGSTATTETARGVEKLIRIRRPGSDKLARADVYFGNAIIEFERSLAATLPEAERQLAEYIAGCWQQETPRRTLLAIATDGIVWRTYQPLPGAKPGAATLELLRDFRLTEENLGEFWLWLTSFLFRPQQVAPTAERFQLDLGSLSPLYRDAIRLLRDAWAAVRAEPEAQVAFQTWQRYLTVTYGSLPAGNGGGTPGESPNPLEHLFLRHTYLTCIARLVIWAALSHGSGGTKRGPAPVSDLREVAREVFDGSYFANKRLANLVDDDFFHWIRRPSAEAALAPAWARILTHLIEYDLRQVNEDVLKGLYQQLIDPKDRHDLGEYYTPDWLCERLVAELLPACGWKTVLDPSCGSGSFLRAAIAHYLAHNPSGTPLERLRAVLASVQGIDIHPVAVTFARATYVLALGKLISAARQPVHIPVYLADALFLPPEVDQSLFDHVKGTEITFGSARPPRRVVIPNTLVQKPELFDEAITACARVSAEHARHARESRESLARHLRRALPELDSLLERDVIVEALWHFTQELAALIRAQQNSIWSFIIRNSYRPAMLRQRAQIIIGNPPWLSYRYIADPDYQTQVKRLAVEQYRIAPRSQKLMTQMELGTVFLAHAMATFAAPDAKLGFVLPRSVLSSDQHQNLIRRGYDTSTHLRLAGYWDLWDVAPLFNVPACVLFAEYGPVSASVDQPLAVETWKGRLPERDLAWHHAQPHLQHASGRGRVIYLGSRAALSTSPGAPSPTKPSPYCDAFRQGATIVPRSFYFVQVTDPTQPVDDARNYWVSTDPEQARSAKPPYQDVKLSGLIEGPFLFQTALAKHILPFRLLPPADIILPITLHDGSPVLRTPDWLSDQGFRDIAQWMRRAGEIWTEKRAAKDTDLMAWLDYQSKLQIQDLRQRHLVLYNAAGTNVSAAYLDRTLLPRFIVDSTAYWACLRSRAEAHYLTAVLNASTVNAAIKPFQSTGLLGERHVHKKLLELPIPRYDPQNSLHHQLADLGAAAHARAAAADPARLGSSLARQRAALRTLLDAELRAINRLVATLLSA